MYLRRNRSSKGDYEYWTLVESVRTARGPRQQIVATLGKLPGLDPGVRAGWEDVHALLDGEAAGKQLTFAGAGPAEKPLWKEVNLRGVRVERAREFGEVYLALALWRRLHFHTLLGQLIESGKEEVPWETIACILTVARFCAQPSELGVAERWYQKTALEDLLGVVWEKINDDRLYRGLDILLEKKDQLTAHLLKRYESWFGVRFEFLVYDVTSTYFEGQGGGAKAARGYSRDNRPDCKQVCIGLVVTPEGLPLAFEVFAGNRTDVTTVEAIVELMENKYGQAERIWVMDRGMVSEENIGFLREKKACYVVGTPKSELKKFAQELLNREGWQKVRPDVEVKLLEHPDGQGTEQFVLCRSGARQEKEKAMLARQEQRLLEQLIKVDQSLQRKAKNPEAVERRLGRWMGRYPAADNLFEVKVLKNQEGLACGLAMACRVDRGQWANRAQGAYLLRTNCTEKDPTKVWDWYLQLQQAEAAFRLGKSDLKLRPIFHQKTERVEAHILVCFLALAMWRVLEMWMKGKGLGTCARQLVAEVGTIKSMDVVLPVRTQEGTTDLRLRVVSKPDRMLAQLLQRLELHLPTRSKIIENVVEKIGA
ncbi:MAG: IS1634 family transposase [Verrucomicrobiota bacterium]